MKTLALMLLCLANAALGAAADCTVTEGQLPAARHNVYEFAQRKTIAAISRPLSSSGLLALSEAGELLWQTRQPLKSTIVIDADGMRVFNRDDKLVNELSDPAIREIASVFLLVLEGDTEALSQSFSAALACASDGRWQLDLQPLTQQLRALLNTVTVRGGENVETISFTEARGDMTEIDLVPADDARLRELESYLGN